jgi:Gram-negative porin
MAVGRRARRALCSGMVAAALALGLAHAPPAIAADLGGNCCGDLEERIADLEATTARKGNRKVSLTVSGWINEALFWWDDGTQQNVYEGTNMVEQSRVKFLGEAKIDKDWSAGYLLEIAVQGHPNREWNQFTSNSVSSNPNNKDDATFPRKSYWFLKSKTYGQIAIGLNGMATYHLLDDADPTLTRNVDDAEGPPIFMSAFLIRSNGLFVNNLRWVDVLRGFNNSTPGDAARREIVRYDSPEWHGLTLSASWGESDVWDAALTYKQTIGDLSVLARTGYGASNDPGIETKGVPTNYVIGGTPCISGTAITTSLPNFECTWEGAAAFLQHEPTGLFLYGGWGRQSVHTAHVFPPGTVFEPDSTTWFIRPGVEKKWCGLGSTEVFANYRHDDPGSNPDRTVSASANFYQLGVIQKLEKADMNLYAIYQLANGSIIGNAATAKAGAPIGTTEIDGFQEVITGAKINF